MKNPITEAFEVLQRLCAEAESRTPAVCHADTPWLSLVRWPKGRVALSDPDDVSTDRHATSSAAEVVCRRLDKEGLEGEGKIFPIWTAIATASSLRLITCRAELGGLESIPVDQVQDCGSPELYKD